MAKRSAAAGAKTAAKKPAKGGPWKREATAGRKGKEFRLRSQQYKKIAAKNLEPDPLNWRKHGAAQVSALQAVLSEIGFVGALLCRPKPRSKTKYLIIDGHGRREEFAADDMVPCLVIDITETEARKIIATHDVVTGLAEADRDAYSTLVESLDFSAADLDDMIDNALRDMPSTYEEIELEADEPDEIEHVEESPVQPSERRTEYARKLVKKWKTKPGQLWLIPSLTSKVTHRLIVGDATHPETVARLLDGERVDTLMTDPPYCSGGFNEAGKGEGSVGTDDVKQKIHNDRLSTRGYQALIRSVIANVAAGAAFIFCDWRMWSYLFDVAESQGVGVRQMIIWDKLHPGMGTGFRPQFEVILFGSTHPIKFNGHISGGNLIGCKRTGNKRHQTEKPVDVFLYLLRVHEAALKVCDPFSGSGPVLIACEQKRRQYFGIELEAANVAVQLERAAEAGMAPRLAD